MLTVTVLDAQGLRKVEEAGMAMPAPINPFIVIQYGPQKRSTTTKVGISNPQWNEPFDFLGIKTL